MQRNAQEIRKALVELMGMAAFAVYANIIADATAMDSNAMFIAV